MEQRLSECLRSALQQWTSALFCNSPSTKLRETCFLQLAKFHRGFSLFLYSAMSAVTAISSKPKATRKRLKKEILSDDFKKRKIFRMGKFSMENCPPHIARCASRNTYGVPVRCVQSFESFSVDLCGCVAVSTPNFSVSLLNCKALLCSPCTVKTRKESSTLLRITIYTSISLPCFSFLGLRRIKQEVTSLRFFFPET
jgi:hypothetical protein